ncbi:DUF3784 domain-containing protein [Runella sp. CRIBMP]|uniref:DUF3784 domain-containing protein n=1 Tax=Runella sp. CRIBMP TaxID=2683261 RepID=UPI001411CE64|nr:DUF3784 domain-containing protein [Runella sp. CRIBMP]NBB23376.1 DUF3784 domain-containing protein [Runella sp. CRIBMP]
MKEIYIFGITGSFLIGLGVFIWKKQAIYLLSNFPRDPNELTDPKGLARWAGIFIIFIGLIFFISGGLTMWLKGTKYELLTIVFLLISTFLLTITYLIGGQRFVKSK